MLNNKSLSIFLLFFVLFLIACNKDNDIAAPDQEGTPEIIFDVPDGIYYVKVGEELLITPEVRNAKDAKYSWYIDGKKVSETLTLSITFDEPVEVYAKFRVEVKGGIAEEEIKIIVEEAAPPIISIVVPSGGIKVLKNTEYVISPDFSCKGEEFTCKWYLDGKISGSGESFVFPPSPVGKYQVRIEASNEDGMTAEEFEIEVVDKLPYKVVFPPMSYFNSQTARTGVVGRPVFLRPLVENISQPTYEWMIDGEKLSGATECQLIYTPKKAGNLKVTVTVKDGITGTQVSADMTITVFASQGNVKPVTGASSSKQNKVFEYVAAPGQFIGETAMIAGFSGNETTLEAANAYALRRMNEGKLVSLGSFGGYIIVGFDHSIVKGPGEYDFSIGGNAIATSNEPGIVWVMQDTNGNGLPDDQWYELRGSETGKEGTDEFYYVTYYRPAGPNMSVRWTDSDGNTGLVSYMQAYHSQPYYYPEWITENSYTLYGTRLTPRNTFDPSTGLWANNPYQWGYCDNLGSDNLSGGSSEDGMNQRTGFKISNAILPDGTPVALNYIDFIKVQTALLTQSGNLGENSTEVLGFRDLSME